MDIYSEQNKEWIIEMHYVCPCYNYCVIHVPTKYQTGIPHELENKRVTYQILNA